MSFSDRDEKIEEKLEESQDNISITLGISYLN